jgi:acyl-CoA reductase-like NAD-dependent aldehyde dehydrogenase
VSTTGNSELRQHGQAMRSPRSEHPWSQQTIRARCRTIAATRHHIAGMAERLVALAENAQRVDPVETISAELIPLCEALKFIGKDGPRLLRPRRLGPWGRPLWLWGVSSEVYRVPLGDVLILAAWNYPLLLPGVQIAQALAAGNRVWLKPAPGCEAISEQLCAAFAAAGVPPDVLHLLPSAPQAARDRIDQGVDLVVLTGSSQTGRNVMACCAQTLTPAIMELSGCDALIVGADADLELVARCLAFALTFNGGATCIGPRRIIVSSQRHRELVERLRTQLTGAARQTLHPSSRDAVEQAIGEALSRGAIDVLQPEAADEPVAQAGSMRPMILDGVAPDWPIASADLFAPVASILRAENDDEMVAIVNRCKYRLAASVFGENRWAIGLAKRLDVGHVSINDLVFPTADARVPFGGCGESGFGVTRGAEGLLAMTRPKVIARHRGRLYLHLRPRQESDAERMLQALRLMHGRRRGR